MNIQLRSRAVSTWLRQGRSPGSWLASALLAALALLAAPVAQAQSTVALAQAPLLALKSAPGLVMLTMSRDHRLYYAAYNDSTDIDGDNVIDVGFKPAITYYGYFVSDRCYKYDTSVTPNRFVPVALAGSLDGCASVSTGRWHGNWMNWMATSRMDALRKVLYGGQRVSDTSSTTVLQAAHIPPDAHIWGKEFRPAPVGTDTYKIENYTPMSAPASGKMHIFLMKSEGSSASTYINLAAPTMRAIADVDIYIDRVWLWASSERPVGGAAGSTGYTRPGARLNNPTPAVIGYGLPGYPSTGTSYTGTSFSAFVAPPAIRVEACVLIGGVREPGCVGYPLNSTSPTSWKPTGVLHEYSVSDSLKFGLLTGSYLNNYSGGVLRKDIGSFKDEVNTTTDGSFSGVVGIAKTIDRLTNYGFEISNQLYGCGFRWNRLRNQGECNMWGAPVGEMMYEGLRYFTDKQPTTAFVTGVNRASSPDTQLTLPTLTSWQNPFRPKASGGSPICSRPVQMVIADPITSFDSDQLPGADYSPTAGYGGSITGDIAGLNVSTQADEIWNKEFGTAASRQFFVGQSSATNYDGNPTSKSATSFKSIRGHAPDETTSQGSYYSASVAKFARETGVDIRASSTATAVNAKVDTLAVALGSVVPRLQMSYAGKTVSLVPFSKMVGGCSNPASPTRVPSGFQPTGLITGVFIDRIANTPMLDSDPAINGGRPFARFMVSFSDGDQGGDNEADANVYYTMAINASGDLDVRMDSYYQATCAQQNMGYVISGTTKDGVYLEVRGVSAGSQVYYLDTLPGQDPAPAAGRATANATAISNSSATRTFALSTTTTGGTYVPRDPLWYAAKYGGPRDKDNEPLVGPAPNNDPLNYFRVTNPANLPAQIGKAFRAAAALAAVASTSVVGVGQRSLGNAAIYQANYDSLTWSSRLYAFSVQSTGVVSDTTLWEASAKIPELPSLRTKLFLGRGGTFQPVQLTFTGYASLGAIEQQDFGSEAIYQYLIGDKSGEERKGGNLRNRGTTDTAGFGSVLGDIVNSDPQIISRKDFGYGAGDAQYATFLATLTTESLAVGSNNGFFHIFDAAATTSGGGELLGFMPQAARANIKDLASTTYSHRYFVDGAIGLGHAKIRLPAGGVPAQTAVGWRSMVVAAGGAGARTVFAINASSQTYTADSILWEINGNTTTAMTPDRLGNVMDRPGIGKLANGKWVAIFGNGYNSPAGTASLFVVDLETGAIIKQIPTNDSPPFTSNGLGSSEIVRITSGNQDTIEYVYGADYKGNIWRFNLSAADPDLWPATAALVYTTPTGRPITAEIKVGAATGNAAIIGKKMVYFGTGSYLSATDPTTTASQALYGIYDSLTSTSNLTPAVLEIDLTISTLSMATATSDQRISSGPTSPWYNVAGMKGWKLAFEGTANNGDPFQTGERVIAPPVRYTAPGLVDAFLFTSIVPGTDDCVAGIDAWITGVDAMTGGFSRVFDGVANNSLRISGGSPRGVFVLQDGGAPALYISQTIFNGNVVSTTFQTSAGGSQSVSINGTAGQTRVLGIKLTSGTPGGTITRQVWRQLK